MHCFFNRFAFRYFFATLGLCAISFQGLDSASGQVIHSMSMASPADAVLPGTVPSGLPPIIVPGKTVELPNELNVLLTQEILKLRDQVQQLAKAKENAERNAAMLAELKQEVEAVRQRAAESNALANKRNTEGEQLIEALKTKLALTKKLSETRLAEAEKKHAQALRSKELALAESVHDRKALGKARQQSDEMIKSLKQRLEVASEAAQDQKKRAAKLTDRTKKLESQLKEANQRFEKMKSAMERQKKKRGGEKKSQENGKGSAKDDN